MSLAIKLKKSKMATFQRVTTLIVYASMVVVVVCGATALRNLQNVNKVTRQMQMSNTFDVTKAPMLHQALRVQGPPSNPDGDNLSVSLDTGMPDGPWRVSVTGTTDTHVPIVVADQQCVSNGWGNCGETQKWVQCGLDPSSTSVTFCFLVHLNNDDLVTISGQFRSNSATVNLLQEPAPDGWKGVGRVLLNPVPVVTGLVDTITGKGAPQPSPRGLTHSFMLKTGFHVIGLQVAVPDKDRPALWFQGAVSGTLANNIAIHNI